MTVSVSKGKTTESSTAHNDRKTNLEHATEEKKKAFYEQAGHKHIRPEYTYLNEDHIEDPHKIYDDEFEDAIKAYNDKQTRDDRKIGKGQALTKKEKENQIIMLEYVDQYRKLNKKQKKYFLDNLPKKAKHPFEELQKAYANKSLRDIRKALTHAKHTDTLGEAYYKKLKHGKQSAQHTEFLFQIGNAADFNKTDKDGNLIDKNGNIIADDDEERTRKFVSLDRTDPDGIWQQSKKVLEKFEKEFEKNNPNLKVFNWSIHMDEASPHLSLQCIPVCKTDKTLGRGKDKIDKTTGKVIQKARRNGLTKKVSLDGALQCEGYKKDVHDSRKMFTQWQHDTADTLTKIMEKELGITRKKGITNRLKDVHEYKHVQAVVAKNIEKTRKQAKTIAKQNKIINKNQQKLNELDNYDLLVTFAKDSVKSFQSQQKVAERKRDEADIARKEAEEKQKTAEQQAKLANINLINSLNEKSNKLDEKEKALDARVSAIIKKEKEQEEKDAELTKRETAVRKFEKAIAKIPKKVKKFFKTYFTERAKARGFNVSQASDYADDIVNNDNLDNAEQINYDLQAHDKASVKAFSKALPELGGIIPETSKIAQSALEYAKTQNKEDKSKKVEYETRAGAVMREPDRATDHKDVEPDLTNEPDEPDLTDDL